MLTPLAGGMSLSNLHCEPPDPKGKQKRDNSTEVVRMLHANLLSRIFRPNADLADMCLCKIGELAFINGVLMLVDHI